MRSALLLFLMLLCLAANGSGCAWRSPPTLAADAPPPAELARVFYARATNRRINSISTFHDPALREFFQTPQAFADWYADLAQDLTAANFEANRATEVTLESLEFEGPDSALFWVRYRGENGLPLRWWSTELVRIDQWRREEGRWFIVPGKL